MKIFAQPTLQPAGVAELTPKQRRIYEFIRRYIEDHGYAPAIRDIGRAFGINSPNGVMCHLIALKKKGFIDRDEKDEDAGNGGRARSITIPGLQLGGFSIPLLGSVAAGKPRASVADSDKLDLHHLFRGDDVYALRVRGESMIESQIADGDYVVIRAQDEAENGATVVASVDGETTLKRLKRNAGTVELHPANGGMKPIVVDPAKEAVKVLGVFLGVIRRAARC